MGQNPDQKRVALLCVVRRWRARDKLALPIRLLAITHSAALGGNQLHMADLLRRFSPADVTVAAVVVPGTGVFGQQLAQMGLPVVTLEIPSLSQMYSPGKLVREIAKWPGFASRFSAVLQEFKPDIVYTNSYRSAIVIEPILTRLRVPLVWKMAEFINPKPWHRLAIHRIMRRASAIVAISGSGREAILRLGATPERVHTIPIGMDLKSFSIPVAQVARFREEQSIAPGVPVVGMIGWIQPLKGWHVLVEAIPLVRASFPRVKFLFVGDCNDDRYRSYQTQLRNRIAELAQEDAVIWLGYRQDVPLIMNACDIVIQASIEPETLGVTILEAMAARKPVICSNLGALPEVNLHGVTGLVVAPNQPVELAETIKRLLGDAELRTRMGAQGRTRVEERFTQQQQIQKYVELFHDIVGRG